MSHITPTPSHSSTRHLEVLAAAAAMVVLLAVASTFLPPPWDELLADLARAIVRALLR